MTFSIADYHPGLASFRALLAEMEMLYHKLDAELAQRNESGQCTACGRCCDFDSFGHRLFLTTPELLYFAHYVTAPLKPMTSGVCPCRIDGKCGVYPFRFAGCRVFQCKGSPEVQSDLTEAALAQFKQLCTRFDVPYYYMDLKTALSNIPVH